jgi:uncharacterized protein (TIGR02145 family)
MKKIVFFATAMSLVMLLPSCKKDKTKNGELSGKIAVQLTTELVGSRLKMMSDKWDVGDELGLYMGAHGDTNTFYARNEKLTYNSDTSLTAAEELYYPNNTGNYDFVAYYPYSSVLTGNLLPISIPTTATVGQEVVYSNNATNKAASNSLVHLQLNYVLPKIEVNVSDTTPQSVSISGVQTAGSLYILDGNVNTSGAASTVAMAYNATTALYEKLLLPTTVTSAAGIRITVVLGGSKSDIVYDFPDSTILTGNNVYRINISTTTQKATISTKIIPRNEVVLYDDSNNSSTAESVEINGVHWATRNVDQPGTFAANPEDLGMFCQWNRKKAWASTGSVTSWDDSYPTGTEWEKANDPSPAGYRVPTLAEIRSLFDTANVTKEWTTVNGVTGREFTDKATGNSVFFPAVGYRDSGDGAFKYVGTYGRYWTSTELGNYGAYTLYFDRSYAGVNFGNRTNGFSVRCVAE